MPQKSKIMVGSVSTTCDSGWVNSSGSKALEYRMLIIDPPATAGGTDRFQVDFLCKADVDRITYTIAENDFEKAIQRIKKSLRKLRRQ